MMNMRQVVPDESHRPVVENILRDKQSGWIHNYYMYAGTSVDIPLARAHAALELKNIHTATLPFENELAALKKRVPLDAKEMTRVKGIIYKNNCEAKRLSAIVGAGEFLKNYTSINATVEELEKKKFTEEYRRSHLQRLRDKFKKDGDIEYLTRAVTWVECSAASMAK
jgi:hypothetical protein